MARVIKNRSSATPIEKPWMLYFVHQRLLDRGAGVSAWACLPVAVWGKSMLRALMTRFYRCGHHHRGPGWPSGVREVKSLFRADSGEGGGKRGGGYGSLGGGWHPPADDAPLMRLRAAGMYCTALPSIFRDQGKNVLLLNGIAGPVSPAAAGKIALAIGEASGDQGLPASCCKTAAIGRQRPGNAEQRRWFDSRRSYQVPIRKG